MALVGRVRGAPRGRHWGWGRGNWVPSTLLSPEKSQLMRAMERAPRLSPEKSLFRSLQCGQITIAFPSPRSSSELTSATTPSRSSAHSARTRVPPAHALADALPSPSSCSRFLRCHMCGPEKPSPRAFLNQSSPNGGSEGRLQEDLACHPMSNSSPVPNASAYHLAPLTHCPVFLFTVVIVLSLKCQLCELRNWGPL